MPRLGLAFPLLQLSPPPLAATLSGRYVWGASSVRPTSAHNSVGKWDTETGSVQVRFYTSCYAVAEVKLCLGLMLLTTCRLGAVMLLSISACLLLPCNPPTSRCGTSLGSWWESPSLCPPPTQQQVSRPLQELQ